MHTVMMVARKEFRDAVRNRWALAVMLLFAVLALAMAYFGATASGKLGFYSFDATIASLTTLAAFVVPLIALLIAYDTVVGERSSGTLPLLLSYPLSRSQLLTGKFVGYSSVLATTTVAGFGLSVALIQILTPEARSLVAWVDIGRFMASASLLGASFVGVACTLSVLTHDKARAAGLALLTWFVLVVLFDLLFLAVLVASGGNPVERAVYPYLLLLNPIDVFRLVNLTALGKGGGNGVFLGMTAAHAYRPWLPWAALAVWSVLPFIGALYAFRKQEV